MWSHLPGGVDMKPVIKRVLKVAGGIASVVIVAGISFVLVETSRFDASLDKVYDLPVPVVVRSTDPVMVSRGQHLVSSVGGCTVTLCHGPDLAGGRPIEMGPVATLVAPNITSANLGAAYSDGEIARLLRHGVKKDGRTVRFMPVQDIDWLPDSDITAIVSYLRTVPPVDRANQGMVIKPLGKILDRRDRIVFDVARHIDHTKAETPPSPAATAEYGAFVGRLCTGCHGEHLSGGPIPGAPASIPTPLNLTPDATGLKDWTYQDFETLMRTAVRKNGKALEPFMPVEAWRNFDDVEMRALWAHLRNLPPMTFGSR
jgi:hypothetical protein